MILNAVEKLSYLPRAEVENAFSVLDRKMLALFDVEAIDESHRTNYEGKIDELIGHACQDTLGSGFATSMRRTYIDPQAPHGKPHCATNLLKGLPVTTAMCENFHMRINQKIPRRHGLRSRTVEVLRDVEASDHDTLLRSKYYPTARITGRSADVPREEYMDDLRNCVRAHVEQFERTGLHSDDQIWAYLKHLVRLIRIGRGGLNANADGELCPWQWMDVGPP